MATNPFEEKEFKEKGSVGLGDIADHINFLKRLNVHDVPNRGEIPSSFDILSEITNVPWVDIRTHGADKENSAVDNNLAIQEAIDTGYNNSETVIVSGGTYKITGLNIYPYTRIVFLGASELKMTLEGGFVMRTKDSPTATTDAPTGPIEGIVIENLRIDMDEKGDVGLMIECGKQSRIIHPRIINVPASTFTYDDGDSSASYVKGGIFLKGIVGEHGCYYNTLIDPYVLGKDINNYGNCGIVLTSTGAKTTQKANFNRIIRPRIHYFEKGIYLYMGSDNYITSPELSICTTCIDDHTDRSVIINPYIENCTTGIDADNANDQLVIGQHASTYTTLYLNSNHQNNRWIYNGDQSTCSVYLSGDQTVTHNATETVEFDTENYDGRSEFNTGTYTFTVIDEGYYRISASALTKEDDEVTIYLYLKVGGVTKAFSGFRGTNGSRNTVTLNTTLQLSTDDAVTLEVFAFNHTDAGNVDIDSSATQTHMEIERVLC